jgi:hypothetical protein
MRFWSIWDFSYPMALKERLRRTVEWFWLTIPDFMPKGLRYWTAMREIGKATMTSQNVPATSLDNVLTNLGNVREGKPLEQFKWEEKDRVDPAV